MTIVVSTGAEARSGELSARAERPARDWLADQFAVAAEVERNWP